MGKLDLIKRPSYLLALFITVFMFLISSCGETTEKEEIKEVQGYVITELLERDKNLSYDEFVRLKAKFETIEIALLKNPQDFASLLKLVEIYVYEARISGEHPYYYQAALQTLAELLKYKTSLNEDQLFTTLMYKATVQLSQHNFNEALETGNAAIEINNYSSGIYGVLVDANVEIGNYKEAISMCDKMMKIRPDLRSYSRTSYLREIYGDIGGSKVAMVQAINAGAPYSEYKCWSIVTLGNIFEGEGELDSAAICYDLSLTERENYPFGIAGKARIQMKKGNYDVANKLFADAIAILPEIGFNIDLASLKKKEGKMAEVERMIKEIETMFKEDIESGHNMNLEYGAFLMSFKGDYQTALDYGLDELERRPNNIDVNKLLAFAYYGLGDETNAMKHIEVALATGKRDADIICLNGLIKNNKSMIKKAFEINPHQDHIYVGQARGLMNGLD